MENDEMHVYRRRGPRVWTLAIAIAVAVGAVAVALAASGGGESPAEAPGQASGTLASGATYRFTADDAGCVRLQVTGTDGSSSNRDECLQLRRVTDYAGSYELDCKTGDLVVYGVLGRDASALKLVGRSSTVTARVVPLPGSSQRSAFVLAGSARGLPGRIRATGAGGRRIGDDTRLTSRAEACRAVGGDQPTEAFGDL